MLGSEPGVGWFTCLSPVRDGGEVGRVRLDHESTGRNLGDGLLKRRSVFEGHDPGEGNEAPESEQLVRTRLCFGEAVENRLGARKMWAKSRDRVFPSSTLVDDHIQT